MVPEELPLGVMLRVAAIYLFRSIARKPAFFDADVKSQGKYISCVFASTLFRLPDLTHDAEQNITSWKSTATCCFYLIPFVNIRGGRSRLSI